MSLIAKAGARWLMLRVKTWALQAKPAAGDGKKAEEEEIDPTQYRQNRITAMEKMEVSFARLLMHNFRAAPLRVRAC